MTKITQEQKFKSMIKYAERKTPIYKLKKLDIKLKELLIYKNNIDFQINKTLKEIDNLKEKINNE